VVCPRCRALIEAADGQPFGTPRYVSPISNEYVAFSGIDPRPDTSGMDQDEAFEAIYGVSIEHHAKSLVEKWSQEDALRQDERIAEGGEETPPIPPARLQGDVQ
jgi:hypothetical protein